MSENTFREATAFHEAGHAVIASCLGSEVLLVSIKETEHLLGRAVLRVPRPEEITNWHTALPNAIAELSAGPIAESIYVRGPVPVVGSSDMREILRIAEFFELTAEERKELIVEICSRLRKFFAQPEVWATVQRLATTLLAQETVQGDQLQEIITELKMTLGNASQA